MASGGNGFQFPSVREVVCIYGEKAEATVRKPTIGERLDTAEEELQLANNELERLRGKLAKSETERLQLLNENQVMKRLAEETATKLEATVLTVQVCNNARLEAEEHGELALKALRGELELTREKHHADVCQLEEHIAVLEVQLDNSLAAFADVRSLVMEVTGTENTTEGLVRLKQELSEANDLLDTLTHQSERSKEEIASLREETRRQACELETARDEVELSRSAKEKATEALELANLETKALHAEVETLKRSLGVAKNAAAVTVFTLAALQNATTQLAEVRTAEASAKMQVDESAREIAVLATELNAARENEAAALLGVKKLEDETRAMKDDISSLTDALHGATTDVEVVKAALAKAQEEAKARTSAEQEKVAEFSEEKMKALEQHFADLRKTIDERESLAHRRVSAALAEASAARIREQQMLIRMDALREELEEAKETASKASRKAETTEAEKVLIENELKRWRKAAKKLGEIRPPGNEVQQHETSKDYESKSSILGTYLSRKKTGDRKR